MRIVISADFEGASGIVSSRETAYPDRPVADPEATPDYLTGRRWLTEDINAAVEGAIEAGATSFVVHDSHGYGYRNIDLDLLHPSVEIVRGLPIFFFEHADLESGYDAAFLIAMHARGGEPGVISHVLNWPSIRDVKLNGELVGESHVSAALAAHYGIPTVLVTGDDIVCRDMSDWSGGQIETAVVKTSLSRYAARCLPLESARQRIREAAFQAVTRAKTATVNRFDAPVTLEVVYQDRLSAWYASFMPSVAYDGNCTVSYTSDDFLSIYKALVAMFLVTRE